MKAETSSTRVGQLVADDGVRDRDAVELRELVVEQRDVRLVLLDLGERRAAVVGLGDDLDLAARGERPHDALAVERMVVGDHDPDPLPALLGHGGVSSCYASRPAPGRCRA